MIADDLYDVESMRNLNGQLLQVSQKDGHTKIGGAEILVRNFLNNAQYYRTR